MFGWFRRGERATEEALASMRSVVATLMERNEALAQENGKLKATVDMQFRDLRNLMERGLPVQAPTAPPQPASPLLGMIPSRSGPVAVPNPPEPKEPPSPAPTFRRFQNQAVSGGHIRAAPGIKVVKEGVKS